MGIRCLDFEIFADVSNQPIIGVTKSLNDCNLTENLEIEDTIPLETVLDFLSSEEEDGGYNKNTCSNWNDPLILHFRVKSTNDLMYVNMAKLIIEYFGSPENNERSNRLLPSKFGYQYSGAPTMPAKNIGAVPLPELLGKVIIFVDANVCCYPEKSFEYNNNRMPDSAMRVKNKNECSENIEYPSCPCAEDYFTWKEINYSADGIASTDQENIFHEIVNAASHSQMLWALNSSKFLNMAESPSEKIPDLMIHNKEFLCMIHPDIRSTDTAVYGEQHVRLALLRGVQFIAIPWLVSEAARENDSTKSDYINNINLLETLFNNKIHSKTATVCSDVELYPDFKTKNAHEDSNSCFLKELYNCNACTGDKCEPENADDDDPSNFYSCGNKYNMPYFHQESAFILKPDQLRYQAILLDVPNPAIATKNPSVEVPIVGTKNPKMLDKDPEDIDSELLRLDIGPTYKNYKSIQGQTEQKIE
jgi:hypothetical protein